MRFKVQLLAVLFVCRVTGEYRGRENAIGRKLLRSNRSSRDKRRKPILFYPNKAPAALEAGE